MPFTRGYAPTYHAWSRYHARYYAMSLLFLAFDMEMVFMYPWAVVFVAEGMKALVEMLMFIVILVLASSTPGASGRSRGRDRERNDDIVDVDDSSPTASIRPRDGRPPSARR